MAIGDFERAAMEPSSQPTPAAARPRASAVGALYKRASADLAETPQAHVERKIAPITTLTEDLRNKIQFRGSLASSFGAINFQSGVRSQEMKELHKLTKKFDEAPQGAMKKAVAEELLDAIAVWETSKGAKLDKTASKPAVGALKAILTEFVAGKVSGPSGKSEVGPIASLADAHKAVSQMEHLDLEGCEETIKAVRDFFIRDPYLEKMPIADVQQLNTSMMKKYFEKLALTAQAALDKPMPKGCEFTFLLLGSAATQTTSPMSDIDYAIVCKDASHKSYLRDLAKKMESMNNKEAFPLCDQVTPTGPALGGYLLGTVAEFNKWQERANKGGGMKRNAMEAASVRVAVGGNAPALATGLTMGVSQTELGKKKLRSIAEFERPGGVSFDVKCEIIRAPSLYIEGLSLLHSIGTGEHTIWEKLELLKENNKISPAMAKNIRDALEFAYRVRYISHVKSQREVDTVFVSTPERKDNPYLVLSEVEVFGSEKELQARITQIDRTIQVIKKRGKKSMNVSTFYRHVEHAEEAVVKALISKEATAPLQTTLTVLCNTEPVTNDMVEKVFCEGAKQRAKAFLLLVQGRDTPSTEDDIAAFRDTYARFRAHPDPASLQSVESEFRRAMGFLFSHLSNSWPLVDLEQNVDPDDPVQAWVFTARLMFESLHTT